MHFSNNSLTKPPLLKQARRHYWFAAFFAFGATMCLLTVVLLVFRETKLDSLWNLNPDARVAFQSLRSWSIALMLVVGTGVCLGSNRSVPRDALGHSAGIGDPLHQHHWRAGECCHAPRLSITHRRADRRRNDLLLGLVNQPPQNSLNAALPVGHTHLKLYAAGIFSRACRRVRAIQTSS